MLATGAAVRRLPVPGADLPGIGYLRELADSDALRAGLEAGARLVVVGGGYIGLEVAAVAARRGVCVTVIETESRLMSRVVSPETSAHYLALHRGEGVDVRTGMRVTGFEGEARVSRVRCADGTAFDADFVVIGIGIVANDALAAAAGLDTGDGVVVDEYGATSQPRVWAAGDCTSHPSRLYRRRVRLESVHNAMSQAKVVAANICGKATPYDEAPWFWSDQYDTKLQIVGLAQGAHERVVRGDPLCLRVHGVPPAGRGGNRGGDRQRHARPPRMPQAGRRAGASGARGPLGPHGGAREARGLMSAARPSACPFAHRAGPRRSAIARRVSPRTSPC